VGLPRYRNIDDQRPVLVGVTLRCRGNVRRRSRASPCYNRGRFARPVARVSSPVVRLTWFRSMPRPGSINHTLWWRFR